MVHHSIIYSLKNLWKLLNQYHIWVLDIILCTFLETRWMIVWIFVVLEHPLCIVLLHTEKLDGFVITFHGFVAETELFDLFFILLFEKYANVFTKFAPNTWLAKNIENTVGLICVNWQNWKFCTFLCARLITIQSVYTFSIWSVNYLRVIDGRLKNLRQIIFVIWTFVVETALYSQWCLW